MNNPELKSIEPEKVEEVDIKDIVVGHRYRRDVGDITDLADSIKQNGLIHPIVVKLAHGGKYQLMAGGRRLEACRSLGMKRVTCNIYPLELDQLRRNIIELCENIHREDMSYPEQVALEKQIHIQMQKLLGDKKPGVSKSGHGLRDTAKMVGKSATTVHDDIILAEAIEQIPELAKYKNKSEAMRVLNRMVKQYNVDEKAKAIEKVKGESPESVIKHDLISAYKLGDFLKLAKDIPDNSADFIDCDPDYGTAMKDNVRIADTTSYGYVEWVKKEYPEKLEATLKECYRILKPDRWIILWFSMEPWFETAYQAMRSAGFKCNRACAHWIKPNGHTVNPYKFLGMANDAFFYGYKGDAKIVKPGRDNLFRYDRPPKDNKVSFAEKPVELMEDILTTFCEPGYKIMVPYLGSGNTILAASNVNMSATGFDLSEEARNGFILNVERGNIDRFKTLKGE